MLDEPSAGLDVSSREEFNQLVRELRDGQRTVLIASHLLSDIESSCTHIAIMQSGRIRVYATAEELLRSARQAHAEKDMFVESVQAKRIAELGIGYEDSRHPGLIRLVFDEPEEVILGRLVAAHIVPARIEPRVNLISIYLEMTGDTERGN